MIEAPSGRRFLDSDIKLATEMADGGFIRWSDTPFRLASGVESHVYVFGREDVTDNPHLEWLIGQKIATIVSFHSLRTEGRRQCLIGVPTAGTVLAQAGAMVSWQTRNRTRVLCHRLMREVKKQHGAHQTWVNGRPDFERHQYWMVDNVATDGESKIEAAKKLEEDGYPAKEMPCLIFVDRQQGAVKRLKREGFKKVVVTYNLLDLAFVFGVLEIWPKETVQHVEEEIAAHQLIT